MLEYVIVADDYTGAVETAAKFMSGGYSTAITLDPTSLGSMRQYSALALDTETFFSTREEAEKKLANAAKSLLPWKNSATFFKRIESTLRGNVGVEVRTMTRVLEPEYVVVTPALSRGRRAIEEGSLHLDEQTASALKPATFLATADVLRENGMELVTVSLDDVRNGKVPEILSGKGCFCFDAETDEDLKSIVQGVLKITHARNVLWVGSIGLAETLATAPRPFLFVVGTVHQRSVRQARQLLELSMAYPVQIDAGTLHEGHQAAETERARVAGDAEELLRCGQSVLLAATLNGRFVRGEYPNGDMDAFLGLLADTARDIIGRVKIGGLCITGGDCTVRVVSKAKAERVALVAEIQDGIALSRLIGGPFDGLPLITKSGALGGERALAHCMEYLLHNL